MRWFQVAIVVLSVTVATGCPTEFGKGGRVDKAVEKDSKEQLLELTKCSDIWKRRVCAPGNENSAECRKCGGP